MNSPQGTLLVVEDDAWTRYALTRLLGRHGWSVVAVPTVAEALEWLPTAPVCIILDLALPDGTGEAVLRGVREAGLGSRVVVCTAIMDEGRLEGLRPLTPDAIIHKPLLMSALLDACSGASLTDLGSGETAADQARPS